MHINILKCSPVKLNKLTLSFSDKCCEDEQNLYSKVFGNFNIIFHVLKNHKKSPPLPLNLIPSKYPKPINSKCIQYYCTPYLFHTPPPPQWEKNYKCLLTSSVFILFDGDAIFRQHWDYRKLLLIYDYNEQIYVKNTITNIYNLFHTF